MPSFVLRCCENCTQACGELTREGSRECRRIFRPNEAGLRLIIAAQKSKISELKEQLKLWRELKHAESLKRLFKENDALRARILALRGGMS